MSALKTFVWEIAGFIIILSLLDIIVPGGKIKKMINLTGGFILVILILTPVARFADKGIDIDSLNIFYTNHLEKENIVKNTKIIEEAQDEMIIKKYKDRIEGDAKRLAENIKMVKSADVTAFIEENVKSSTFGMITGLKVDYRTASDSGELSQSETGERYINITEIEKEMKEKLSKAFEIKDEYISLNHAK